MLWIALAAQLSGPLPEETETVFSVDDMPEYVLRAGINRFVLTRTTVGLDGIPQNCVIERSSGDAALDAYTCAIIVKRARLRPAKWIDGSPSYSVLRVPISWTIGGPPSSSELQKAYRADIDIMVNRLPDGAKSPISVRLMIAVDQNGRPVACDEAPRPSGRSHDKVFPKLVPIACQQMMSQYKAIPAKDESGKPVRSVQNATVDFSSGS